MMPLLKAKCEVMGFFPLEMYTITDHKTKYHKT